MIDTVIFDIGNVLVDFAWRDFLKEKGFDDAMIERIAKATVHDKDWAEYDRGVLTTEEILDLFAKNDPEIGDIIKATFSSLEGIIRKRDYAINWINELKAQGIRVLYLSNFSYQALSTNREALNFIEHTDGGILSYKDNVIKPDMEIYKLLIERYNLIPENCLFIDDLEENLEAARKLSIKTHKYENTPYVTRDILGY